MKRINERNVKETYFKGQHLNLADLKREPIENWYLFKENIPPYPELVEFHVEKVSHVTGELGLRGIFQDSGFRQPSHMVASDQPYLLWWDLSVTSDDISNAEEKFLTSLFPHRSPAQIRNQPPVLKHFTSSSAFKNESSYGNFRFTLSLKELLWHYGDQFCGGHSPVLRVYETVLYRREILYKVLVHPHDKNDLYVSYPRLPDQVVGVCGYCDGAMWWHCQAPSETYKHKFEMNWSDKSVDMSLHYNEEYYLWDHVSVAFHMEPGWVLHVDQNKLLKRVSACEVSKPCLLKPLDAPLSLNQAEQILADLMPSKKMIRKNARNCKGTHFEGQHLSLSDLKREPIENRYLFKENIPPYPESVEFHVEKVSHVTTKQGLWSIFQDSGFRQPSSDQPPFLWWGLSVSAEDISSAEEHFLAYESLFPDQKSPVLEYFTSSKAFQEESSYGNFSFTFSLKELLWHYGDQFCDGQSPVLRVYETALYKQEIQYTVVVHPKSVHLYDHCPRLPKHGDGVCGYHNGAIWWHCQAPSETHNYRLEVNRSDRSVGVQPCHKVYYVWDHVSVAFHMEPEWVLKVDKNKLLKRVSACEVSEPCLLRPPDAPLSLNQAEQELADLKAKIDRV